MDSFHTMALLLGGQFFTDKCKSFCEMSTSIYIHPAHASRCRRCLLSFEVEFRLAPHFKVNVRPFASASSGNLPGLHSQAAPPQLHWKLWWSWAGTWVHAKAGRTLVLGVWIKTEIQFHPKPTATSSTTLKHIKARNTSELDRKGLGSPP